MHKSIDFHSKIRAAELGYPGVGRDRIAGKCGNYLAIASGHHKSEYRKEISSRFNIIKMFNAVVARQVAVSATGSKKVSRRAICRVVTVSWDINDNYWDRSVLVAPHRCLSCPELGRGAGSQSVQLD